MARLFFNFLNNSAAVDAAPVSSYPFCMGVWLRKDGGSNLETLMFFGDKDTFIVAYTRLLITKFGNITADSAHTDNVVTTSDAYDDDKWHACLLVERDSGGFRHLDLYVDGTFIGTDMNANPGGVSIFNRVAFGRALGPTPFDSLQGTLAEGFIANVDPTAEQVASWSRGASARHVFGNALKGYWPLWGLHDPEIDVSGQRNDLTLAGTGKNDQAPVAPYTPKWAASLPAANATTRRISIDGVVIEVVA